MSLKEICKVSFLLIFILFVFIFSLQKSNENTKEDEAAAVKTYQLQADEAKLQSIVNNTTAKGVVVYDFQADKVLASKNIDKTYTLASLTKIITATIVYQHDKSKLNEIRHMLKVSSNEEAESLALIFGKTPEEKSDYMDNFTKEYNMHFRTASGLDTDDGLPGGTAKPMDLINFIKKYYPEEPELFDQTIKENGGNTNLIVDDLSFLSAGKTGFTDLAGGNLFVSVQKGLGREIFILVLNSTEENRFVDVQHIANFLLQSSI